ncbi:LysM peptidoglycan-binding domain-containing protein [Streptomyces sp. NPDC005373]|uniref:LysM peptidoglycan-binding domain-containing protein n=1 Tax=Streptomyces sp. NPDC005373 TaxID=3156879 RepID=UPI0033BDCC77
MSPTPGRPALAVRMLRAAGSLAALLLLLVGVPLVLAWAGTLPSAIPSPADIAEMLVSADDGVQVLFTVLTVAAWLLWLWFVLSVLSVLAELPALLMRRPARRRCPLGAAQRLASFLLGGLLLVPAGTAVAAASPAQAVSAPILPQQAAAETPGATAQSASAVSSSSSSPPVHVVGETGETVWDLAVEYLGAGTRSAEIRQLNPQLPDTAMLPAGTQVTLPADARAPHPPAALTDTSGASRVQLAAASAETGPKTQDAGTRPVSRSHVVTPDETISKIAEQETGEAANWSKVYEASRGAQPHGLPRLTDPDLIFPGQRITIPAAVAPDDHRGDSSGRQDQERPPASDDQHPSAGAGSSHGDDDAADEPDRGSDAGATAASPAAKPAPEHSGRPASPSARPSERTRPPATATPTASTRGHEHSPAASPRSAETGSSSVVSTRTAVGVFALLAAALTGTLALRRLRQRRSRQPGQSLPQTVPAPVEAELELAAGDGSAGVLRLHAALSALAHQAGGTGPPLRAARITADGVQVLPADVAAEPVAPFTTSRAGWWELPHAADFSVPEDGSATAVPYPALVTLGSDTGGDLVLANLPALEVLLVDGEPADRMEVIAALAAELTLGPFADHIEVVACAMGSMGADLAALGVQYLPDPRLAAAEFAGRLLEAHQEPEDSALPYVLLCAGLDDDVAWQLAETLDKAQGLVPAVLVMPATANAMFPDAETLDATTSKPQRIDTIGCDLVLQHLDAASLAELADAYRQSSKQPVHADGVWEHIPPETIPLPDPAPPAVAVPHPGQDIGDAAADPRPAGEEQAAAPVGFQALLGPAADPGQTPLRAVQTPPAPSTESGSSGAPPERIGPRFRIPPSHTILTPERVAAIGETDEDKALSEAGPDDAAPRLRILGGLHVEHAELEPRLTELAAHLLLRPGSSAQVLCEDLGNREPWSTSTLNSRLRALRNRLGTDPDGALYVPQRVSKASPYALSDTVRCDWTEFERLAELGVSRGEEGLHYLERALALVGGVPLGEHSSSWMVPLRTYMQNRIADVASTLATYRTLAGPHQDFPSARQACATGLLADSLAETLHRAMLKIEAAAGNRTGLRTAVAHWQDATRHLSEVDAKTQALVDKLLSA